MATLKRQSDNYLYALRRAVQALGLIGSDRAVEPLLAMLEGDQGHFMGDEVANALGQIGSDRAVEALVTMLKGENSSIRGWAVEGLSQIGNEQVRKVIIPLLNDQDKHRRLAAAATLGRMGDDRALEILLDGLDEEETSMRREVVEALGKIGGESVKKVLLTALGDTDKPVCDAATTELIAMASEDEADSRLLSQDWDGLPPFIDFREHISEGRVRTAAKRLNMPVAEVRRRYERLGSLLPLKFA